MECTLTLTLTSHSVAPHPHSPLTSYSYLQGSLYCASSFICRAEPRLAPALTLEGILGMHTCNTAPAPACWCRL